MMNCVKLPSGKSIDLIYLAAYPASPISYLHHKRTPRASLAAEEKVLYLLWEKRYMDALAGAVFVSLKQADAMCCVESSHDDAKKYFEVISNAMVGSEDISDQIHRIDPTIRAAAEDTDDQQIIENFGYHPSGTNNLSGVQSLLIVDDIFNTGRTVDAIQKVIVGTGAPATISITVAVPLYIPPKTAQLCQKSNSVAEMMGDAEVSG